MRVLVCGAGPWPTEPGAVVTAPAIRLRLFVEALQRAGHAVAALLLESSERASVPIPDAVRAFALPPEQFLAPGQVAARLKDFRPEAVLGVGTLMPCTGATRIARHFSVPSWVDLNGDPLTELHAVQSRPGVAFDATARDHVWKLLREALLHGDRFSTCSGPQRHALLGQLALLGRLGCDPAASHRVAVVPNGVPPAWADEGPLPVWPDALPPGARYVFFGGSWNPWMDEALLARTLRRLLDQEPRVQVVLAGIPVDGLGEQLRGTVEGALREAGHGSNLRTLPPPTGLEEASLLAHAGAVMSFDRLIPESELGARNRLLPLVRWGVRPLLTTTAEIERELAAEGLAVGAPAWTEATAATAVQGLLARGPEERRQDVARGRAWLRRAATYDVVAAPAVAWLAAGCPRWPVPPAGGLLDAWAALPAETERLFPAPPRTSLLRRMVRRLRGQG